MTQAPDDFDVVVAGGGPVGATLTLGLARSGLRVALIDPGEGPPADDDPRAYAISPASMNQWRALEVADRVLPHAEPILSIAVSDAAAPGAARGRARSGFLRFDGADLAPGEAAGPLGYMVESRHVRRALEEALEAAGARVFKGEKLEAVAVDARSAEGRLSGGGRLRAPLVAGADGRRSPVREAAGVGAFGWGYGQTGIVATVALTAPHRGVAHEIFLPGGPLAVLPLSGDRASLVWTERSAAAAALLAASDDAFEAHLFRRFGAELGRPRLTGRRAGFPLSLQMAEAMIAPRTALLGDAAHAIHPIAGQGLNLGLKDAAALCEVVVEARRLGEDWGAALTLERYQRWRRFDAATLAAATDVFTRLFSTDARAVRAVRDAGLFLVNRAPALRRMFVREAAGLLGDVPRLLRGQTP